MNHTFYLVSADAGIDYDLPSANTIREWIQALNEQDGQTGNNVLFESATGGQFPIPGIPAPRPAMYVSVETSLKKNDLRDQLLSLIDADESSEYADKFMIVFDND